MQLKIFISSRLEELEEERTAIEGAISELWNNENLPFKAWKWESAKEIPTGKPSPKVQSKEVRDSDIYVLIMGSEYGDFEYGESPTHKEYKTACSEIEEDCILIYIKKIGRREEKLEKWIEEIKNKHTFKSFVNPYQLKDLVKTRLRDLWNKGKWKASIPTIQSVLRKGETLEGDFFKKEPEWIDFKEGFVVEREETDDVINKLENDNIQLVLGEPASGKSVILKNVGFKLAKENKDVYVVELRKHSIDEVKCYFDDIPKINDEKAVFIVDDAHFLTTECEKLVREFKNRNLKKKLLIGSRPTREIRGEHPKEASVFEHLSKTYIHAEDVTEEIIKGFLKKEHHFSDERIKTVSKNLERYKKDLWHLSWALKTYDPEKDSVEEEEIYKKIRDSIREIKLGKDESRKNKYLNAEDVFLPLSIFYRFEIPVERKFMVKQLGIEKDKINKLIELSEIIETEEIGRNKMLSLFHSSIADLYFRVYRAYPSLGEELKDKIVNQKEENLEYCLFYKYMTSIDPRNAIDVVYHLVRDWRHEKVGKLLLKKLIEDRNIKDIIRKGIEKEGDLEKIGWCMYNTPIGYKLADQIVDTLLTKIEKEGDVAKIGFCVWNSYFIYRSRSKAYSKLFDIILSKIEKEEDIDTIGSYMMGIAKVGIYGDENTVSKLLDAVSFKIEKIIEKGENMEMIMLQLGRIAFVDEEVAQEIVNHINPKIREELQKEGGLK